MKKELGASRGPESPGQRVMEDEKRERETETGDRRSWMSDCHRKTA